jgi:hypothetical protein
MKSMKPPLRASLLGCAALFALPLRAEDASTFSAVSIRLFEQADGTVLPFGRRLYATQFDATLTQMVGVEIDATYPMPKEATLLDVTCTMQKPDGSRVEGSRPMSFQLFAGETQSNSANTQWGVPDEEDWQPGEYGVTCSIGEQKIAEAGFTIVLNPPDVMDTDVRVAGLRFFPVDRELPTKAERDYSEVFETADTRRIGVELEYTHSALGRTVSVPVACHYYWPDGQVMPPAEMLYEPGPTWPGGYSAANMGWDEAGKWPVGHYVVVCRVNGRPTVVGRFEVR